MQEPGSQGRILVIEDHLRTGEAVVAALSKQGYVATLAGSGEEGFFLIHQDRPDLVLLDLTLPRRGGLEILAQIRAEAFDTRVLIVTSHNSVEDRVAGLSAGADDYLGKPFSMAELIARVSALMRRKTQKASVVAASFADLEINRETRTVQRSKFPLDLTAREYDILLYLVEHRGKTVSREMLIKDVWKEVSRFTPLDNVIDTQMKRLRRKLDDPFPVKLLHTLRGIGFVLRQEEGEEE